jgi:hypothetical protein
MTPHDVDTRLDTRVDTREDRADEHLSTADLAKSTSRPMSGPTASRTPNMEPDSNTPLFAANDAQDFRSRWERIQTGFVDEPRKAVEQADELVANAIKRLAEVFAGERQKLEGEWDRNDNVSTEDLRVALRKYRSFFDRLLSV